MCVCVLVLSATLKFVHLAPCVRFVIGCVLRPTCVYTWQTGHLEDEVFFWLTDLQPGSWPRFIKWKSNYNNTTDTFNINDVELFIDHHQLTNLAALKVHPTSLSVHASATASACSVPWSLHLAVTFI